MVKIARQKAKQKQQKKPAEKFVLNETATAHLLQLKGDIKSGEARYFDRPGCHQFSVAHSGDFLDVGFLVLTGGDHYGDPIFTFRLLKGGRFQLAWINQIIGVEEPRNFADVAFAANALKGWVQMYLVEKLGKESFSRKSKRRAS